SHRLKIIVVNNDKEDESARLALQNLTRCTGQRFEMLDYRSRGLVDLVAHESPDLAILTGSNFMLSKSDTKTVFQQEMDLVRKLDIPFLGICFGHQLIGATYGAEVNDLGQTIRAFKEVKLLANPNLSEQNKKTILRFYEACRAEGLRPLRLLRLLQLMRLIGGSLKKPFDKVTRSDAQKYLAWLERQELADWTKHGYKVALKKFYKWLRNSETYPPEVSWIKTTVNNGHRLLPEELLTEDDVKKMAEKAEHPRDRALIMVLYEGGFRVGEILGLQIKHVSFDNNGAQIMVAGKTGM